MIVSKGFVSSKAPRRTRAGQASSDKAKAMPAASGKAHRTGNPILAQARRAAELDQQQAHTAHHVQRQQHHQPPFGGLEERLVGQRQEAVECGRTVQGLAQRPEVQRQEQRQAQARQAVHQEGPVRRVRAGALVVAALHAAAPGATTASTARRPATASSSDQRQRQHARRALAEAPPLARDVGQPDRHVHRAGDDEHRVEGAKGPVALRAAQDLGRAEPAAHGVDHARQVHQHAQRQHHRADALPVPAAGLRDGQAQRVVRAGAFTAHPAPPPWRPCASGRRWPAWAPAAWGSARCRSPACGRRGSRRRRPRRAAARSGRRRARR